MDLNLNQDWVEDTDLRVISVWGAIEILRVHKKSKGCMSREREEQVSSETPCFNRWAEEVKKEAEEIGKKAVS